MKLSEYLADKQISVADFAVGIGVERQSVHRWLSGQRFPDRVMLSKIMAATDGLVTANDFISQTQSRSVAEAS